ncbi:MAG: S1C family serine protease [Leptolyngbya sp. BL-A-14]
MRFYRWFWIGTLLLLAHTLASYIPSIKPLPLSLPGTPNAKPGHPELTSASACQAVRSAVVTLYAGSEFGSGSIISAQGLVLTNHHVVKDSENGQIRARSWSGKLFKGQVLATDLVNDLALVQLGTKEALPVIPLASSNDLQLGQKVCAIGSPFGRTGITALGTLTGRRGNGDLQSSILLHPGNSGGPLLNSQGEMIGVNKAIWLSESGENVGIGFATTTAVAQHFIEQNRQKVEAAAQSTPATAETPQAPADLHTPDTPPTQPEPSAPSQGMRLGALVNEQSLVIQLVEPNSPAENAGLSAGDRLLAINGQRLTRIEDLQAFLKHSPSTAVFTISRNQQQQDVQVGF